MDQKENKKQQEQLEDFAGMKFSGLASDVIGYAKHELDKWRTIAFILAVGVVIEAGILAVILM